MEAASDYASAGGQGWVPIMLSVQNWAGGRAGPLVLVCQLPVKERPRGDPSQTRHLRGGRTLLRARATPAAGTWALLPAEARATDLNVPPDFGPCLGFCCFSEEQWKGPGLLTDVSGKEAYTFN